MENIQKIMRMDRIGRLEKSIEYLKTEIKMLKEKHRQEIQDWQKACSFLEDEILEIQEREGV